MADLLDIKVSGMAQLQRNLAAFGSDKVVGKIIRAAMQAGGRVVRPRAATNARALGLGRQGLMRREDGRTLKRYGRIPKAMKVGRAYIPRGNANLYRVNVVARGQREKGIYPDKAPHAHLIEYGFTVKGRKVAGRPFAGPALATTAQQAVEKVRDTMSKKIDALRMPMK